MDNSVAAYSHDDNSIPLGYEIPGELYEEALTQPLTVLNEKGKHRLTRWGAIAYEYAFEKALAHPELSAEQQESVVDSHFPGELLTEGLKKAIDHYGATLIFDESELAED
ncbi:hypothetical protein [Leptolyngbya sp. BC1307]|uniref:hypothetical protein n=1 Tax=Leptolyngbya sp. BC1307 TaxID=2029589 RepID=UPI000EFBD3B0|nr:hypothetical protein [Leptolyngbya sp. BC1307]